MSAAQDALREAAAAEQARYSRPFVEGPRFATYRPVSSADLLAIYQRRAVLLAAFAEARHLEAVRESA